MSRYASNGGHQANADRSTPATDADVDENDYEGLWALADQLGDVKQRGLDQGDIDRLPTALFKQPTRPDVDARGAGRRDDDDDDKKQCKICFEEFAPAELLRTLPCTHIFHQACIDHWLATNAICPICRIEIKDVLSENDNPSFASS